MKLIDIMIAWTPNRAPTDSYPTTGEVVVFEGPRISEHSSSFGVCDYDWSDITHMERLDRVQKAIRVMVHEDAILPATVSAALAKVDDIRPGDLNFNPAL